MKDNSEKILLYLKGFDNSKAPMDAECKKLSALGFSFSFFCAVVNYAFVDKFIQSWGCKSELETMQCKNVQRAQESAEERDYLVLNMLLKAN